ncbi:MAG TPA: hypothetical protein VEU76_00920 [Candidatus Udaeobacter sp.]|nr:hypothetical protein [Candidatus Udaeobacter sp.]
MSQSIAFRDGGLHVRLFMAILALIAALLVGSAGGYIARSIALPATTTAPQVVYESPSPQRTILPNQV